MPTVEFPNDSDGDGNALRGLQDRGSDMTKPMYIDFHVAMPTQESGEALATIAKKLGYRAEVYDSAECRLPWTCQCSTRMLATFDGVITIQEELASLAKPLGGFPDGWGSFGNKPGGQYDIE